MKQTTTGDPRALWLGRRLVGATLAALVLAGAASTSVAQPSVSLRLPSGDFKDLGLVMRRSHDTAKAIGAGGGRPNGEEAQRGPIHYLGVILIKREAMGWHDVPANQLRTKNAGELCRSAHDWCSRKGYVGGYPNFHKGRKGVRGVVGIKKGYGIRRDVPISGVKSGDIKGLFRAVHRWAKSNGYATGFPNMHKAKRGGRLYYGAILLKGKACIVRDLPTKSVGHEIPNMPRMKQPDDISCGPTSCSIVLKRYGISAGIGPLKTQAGTRKLGDIVGWTHPDGIVKALRAYGLGCRKRTGVSLQDLYDTLESNRPAIVLLRSGKAYWHWVAVYGYDKRSGTVLVSDPGHGMKYPMLVKHLQGAWRFSHDMNGSYIPDPECPTCGGSGRIRGWLHCVRCDGDGKLTDTWRKLVETADARGHTMIVPNRPAP